MKVIDLTRECQYCYDDEYGRSRCGRLAETTITRIYGKPPKRQISFRCREHRGKINDTTLHALFSSGIKEGQTFGLGYKP